MASVRPSLIEAVCWQYERAKLAWLSSEANLALSTKSTDITHPGRWMTWCKARPA